MSPAEEIASLRGQLEELASRFDTAVTDRYALRFPPAESRSLYRQLRMLAGRLLRWLRLRRTLPPEPWLPGLNHVESSNGAKPYVIWAFGLDRDTLREACRGFKSLQASLPGWVPVLITDVADFAYFSRLGWLVEYVPTLAAPAEGYAERKRRYLAWFYRDAPVLPAMAGLTEESISCAGAEIARLKT